MCDSSQNLSYRYFSNGESIVLFDFPSLFMSQTRNGVHKGSHLMNRMYSLSEWVKLKGFSIYIDRYGYVYDL